MKSSIRRLYSPSVSSVILSHLCGARRLENVQRQTLENSDPPSFLFPRSKPSRGNTRWIIDRTERRFLISFNLTVSRFVLYDVSW